MAKIVIYTTNYCPYCKKAKAMLDMKGLIYEEIDITENEDEMMEKLYDMTGGSSTVPQIFINNKPIGGSSNLETLIKSGDFDKLMQE